MIRTALLIVAVASQAAAGELNGRVIAIVDGDTIDVLDGQQRQHRVRIHGIDAPERGQPFASRAKEHLGKFVFGKTVRILTEGDDRYGRKIGRVEVDGQEVNLAMLKAGMAWHYAKYDHTPAYVAAEKAARDDKVGLWADEHAVPPWDWRKMPKAERDTVRKAVNSEVE